jgi:hypothetical protein
MCKIKVFKEFLISKSRSWIQLVQFAGRKTFAALSKMHPLDEHNIAPRKALLAACYMLIPCLAYFDPEDGGHIFLQNAGWLSPDYTTQYP